MDDNRESGFQLVDSGPEAYEAYLVPTLFEHCAEQLLAAVGVSPGDRVIDVACGTGIVARRAVELVGSDGSVVGVDVNPGMLSVARRLARDVDWRVADAAELPLADGAVDVWCCQHGLQFVPDPDAVLREAHRVLAPGGRLCVGLWGHVDDNSAFAGFADVLGDVVGAEAAAMMRAPFALPDRTDLRERLTAAGFREVRVVALAFAARFPSVRELLRQEIAASPLADTVAGLSTAAQERLAVELEQRLDHLTDDDGVVAPMLTWLAVAQRSEGDSLGS